MIQPARCLAVVLFGLASRLATGAQKGGIHQRTSVSDSLHRRVRLRRGLRPAGDGLLEPFLRADRSDSVTGFVEVEHDDVKHDLHSVAESWERLRPNLDQVLERAHELRSSLQSAWQVADARSQLGKRRTNARELRGELANLRVQLQNLQGALGDPAEPQAETSVSAGAGSQAATQLRHAARSRLAGHSTDGRSRGNLGIDNSTGDGQDDQPSDETLMEQQLDLAQAIAEQSDAITLAAVDLLEHQVRYNESLQEQESAFWSYYQAHHTSIGVEYRWWKQEQIMQLDRQYKNMNESQLQVLTDEINVERLGVLERSTRVPGGKLQAPPSATLAGASSDEHRAKAGATLAETQRGAPEWRGARRLREEPDSTDTDVSLGNEELRELRRATAEATSIYVDDAWALTSLSRDWKRAIDAEVLAEYFWRDTNISVNGNATAMRAATELVDDAVDVLNLLNDDLLKVQCQLYGIYCEDDSGGGSDLGAWFWILISCAILAVLVGVGLLASWAMMKRDSPN